jgi:hypothetical protein
MATLPRSYNRIIKALAHRARLGGHPEPEGIAVRMLLGWIHVGPTPAFRAIRKTLVSPRAIVQPRRGHENFPRVLYVPQGQDRGPWAYCPASWSKREVWELRKAGTAAWIRGNGTVTLFWRDSPNAQYYRQRTIPAGEVLHFHYRREA